MKNKISKKVLSIAVATAMMGAAITAQADVKIGVAGPFSGPLAQFGQMQIDGINMAAKHLNANGGINGEKVEIVQYDDACEPKQATSVANQAVNDGVMFVIGHLCSSSTLPASDVYEDEGVVMITPASTNPQITERGYEFLFRTVGRDDQQGPFAAQVVANTNPSNVAVIHDKSAYGEGLASQVKTKLESLGVNVVLFEAITPNEADYSPLITKLKSNKIDAMFFGGYDPEMAKIMRQGRDSGYKGQFFGGDGVSNSKVVEAAGAAAEGLIATQPKAFDGDPMNQALVAEFKAAGVNPSDTFVLPTYAAITALAEAITKAGSFDGEEVIKALRSGTYATAVGDIQWDAKGDIVGGENTFAAYRWKQDGTYDLVK